MKRVVIDYETYGIENGSPRTPRPIGVAYQKEGEKPIYVDMVETKYPEARKIIKSLYDNYKIICHNTAFDLRVSNEYLGLPLVPKHGFDDTMLMAFIHDPYTSTALKKKVKELFNIDNDEQQVVRDWFFDNLPEVTFGKSRSTWTGFMGLLHLAPPELVGKYAMMDCEYTWMLHEFYERNHIHESLGYQTELKLVPILVQSSQRGVRVDRETMTRDEYVYGQLLEMVETKIRSELEIADDFNLNEGANLVQTLLNKGVILNEDVIYTASGRISFSEKNIIKMLNGSDSEIKSLFSYWFHLTKILSTYVTGWLKMTHQKIAAETGESMGYFLHPQVSQVRAVTGRLQSNSPSVMNIPKIDEEKDEIKYRPILDGFGVNEDIFPNPRKYIIPLDASHCLISPDFSGQEIRILAHYEKGKLADAYKQDARIDIHDHTMKMIKSMFSLELTRKAVKIISFMNIYGGGDNAIAEALNIASSKAKRFKDAYLSVFSGIGKLKDLLYGRMMQNRPFRTLGGREYKVRKDKPYTALNYLIQGSAGDMTKHSLIDYYGSSHGLGALYFTVHDEILLSVPKESLNKEVMKVVQAMEKPRFNMEIPMIADVSVGFKNWGSLEEWSISVH